MASVLVAEAVFLVAAKVLVAVLVLVVEAVLVAATVFLFVTAKTADCEFVTLQMSQDGAWVADKVLVVLVVVGVLAEGKQVGM